MEKGLLNWFKDNVKKNIVLTSGDIRKKAMELSTFTDFAASKTWFKKFKVRNRLVVERPKRGNKASNVV